LTATINARTAEAACFLYDSSGVSTSSDICDADTDDYGLAGPTIGDCPVGWTPNGTSWCEYFDGATTRYITGWAMVQIFDNPSLFVDDLISVEVSNELDGCVNPYCVAISYHVYVRENCLPTENDLWFFVGGFSVGANQRFPAIFSRIAEESCVLVARFAHGGSYPDLRIHHVENARDGT
jgi:hypothetical protein